jgi:hypothetical protein
VRFYGISAQGFSCTTDLPEAKLTGGVEIGPEAISVNCNRDNPTEITVSGEKFTKLNRGTISVKTAANPFLLTFVEEVTPTLPKAAADKLSEEIDKLKKDLVETKARLDTVNAQLDGRIKPLEGSLAITSGLKELHLQTNGIASCMGVQQAPGATFWPVVMVPCAGNGLYQRWTLNIQ